jgi:hypothetical protein
MYGIIHTYVWKQTEWIDAIRTPVRNWYARVPKSVPAPDHQRYESAERCEGDARGAATNGKVI